MKKYSPKTAAEAMRALESSDDIEARHADADKLLCDILKSLGYKQVVVVFEYMDKWYA
jgi:hypothetical protein